ncbi:MAG: hypothetical protein UHS54_10275 [Lachnospiraceae bacterium]|nr:hypothetical protein [Lachnospiraceae bacterium]
MLKKIEPIIREIWGVLLIYGALVQLIGMWLVDDKAGYTIGLWIGVAVAGFMIWHMHLGLSKALDMDSEGARNRSLRMYAVRLLVIVVVSILMIYLNIGNIIMTFIGMFGLKPAAYLQPSLHAFLEKRAGEGR